ncbi:TPA: NADH-quinone oxidoreductase subunit M [Candidatus Bathyarchaeota archaeon]|nr:NADH-quinone oxidoreductase subunit M [Candidatus Bathyarchaeota archaeon]
MDYALLMVFVLPTIAVPFVYFAGKKSAKMAALLVAAIALVNIGMILTTVPTIMNSVDHRYIESYRWIPVLNAEFTLFVDGISCSIAIISLILIIAAALFSVNYMEGKKNLPVYYVLMSLLSVGLVGVFITSNLLLFYFCWELMLVPAYFIVGNWGYRESYRAAFKLFIFTHAGAVFVLLGIGSIYMATHGLTDIFQAQQALMNASPNLLRWILVALTAGFAVKMAVVPVHMWLPDAHSEAPATMSALLSGVIISAGAYAILRLSLGTVFPAVMSLDSGFGVAFVHGLAIFGVISAFFGSLIALVETDIKRIIAYSSIAHMGYVMFGLSLFPSHPLAGGTVAITAAITGTVLHLINHAVSKGLFFLSAGAVMHQTEVRDVNEMGGLAGKMPFTTVNSAIAALSIAGTPPFACFISEFLIFVGAFEVIKTDGFFILPTALMLVATVLSLAYSLRFVSKVFLGQSKNGAEGEKKIVDVPNYMKLAMVLLVIFVILLGIYPTFFVHLINTVSFG